MAVLDPVPLDQLAAYLRDETWLDLQVVEHGLVRRGRVIEIRVRRLDEEIAVEQEYVAEGRKPDDETPVERLQHAFDHDSIRWARPTSFEIQDVPPPDLRSPEQKQQAARAHAEQAARDKAREHFEANPLYNPPPWQVPPQDAYSWRTVERIIKDHPDVRDIRAAAIKSLSTFTGLPVDELLWDSKKPATMARKWCIRMVYELTDVPQSDIAYLFGYRSGGMSTFALRETEDIPCARSRFAEMEQWLGRPITSRRTIKAPSCKQKRLLTV